MNCGMKDNERYIMKYIIREKDIERMKKIMIE